MKKISILLIFTTFSLGYSQSTQTRNDAGLRGDAGAISGFFETYNPVNYPAGASSWWHLFDVRHTNPGNNYAMQFAGSFFDQDLWFRKTNDNASQPWRKVVTIDNSGVLEFPGLIRSNSNSNEGGSISLFNPSKIGNNANNWTIYNMTGGYGNSLQFWNYTSSGLYGAKLIISDSGNMSLPLGKFEAKEVKVTTTPTADFVFAENYKLPTLEEVERHIKEKKHLPEIASAKEMEKEGVNVGAFQIKLLQKIEELTLYTIEQDKKIKLLYKKIELQNSEINKLKYNDNEK